MNYSTWVNVLIIILIQHKHRLGNSDKVKHFDLLFFHFQEEVETDNEQSKYTIVIIVSINNPSISITL